MKVFLSASRIGRAAILVACLLIAGCAGSGGSGHVHGSVYMGAGYYDPWYWDRIDDPIYIGPPPARPDRPDRPGVERPPRPAHPIARPRPSARSRGGGRRR